jgi:hypothetical protein
MERRLRRERTKTKGKIMRGISEDQLKDLIENDGVGDYICISELIDECTELQEPWMEIDDFLKIEFKGWCWIFDATRPEAIFAYAYQDGTFTGTMIHDCNCITHVMPIHKPEPPK